jgi:hypothetical protein
MLDPGSTSQCAGTRHSASPPHTGPRHWSPCPSPCPGRAFTVREGAPRCRGSRAQGDRVPRNKPTHSHPHRLQGPHDPTTRSQRLHLSPGTCVFDTCPHPLWVVAPARSCAEGLCSTGLCQGAERHVTHLCSPGHTGEHCDIGKIPTGYGGAAGTG